MNTLSPGEGCWLGSSLEGVRVVDAQGRARPGEHSLIKVDLTCQSLAPVLVLDRGRPPVRRDTSGKMSCSTILEKRE